VFSPNVDGCFAPSEAVRLHDAAAVCRAAFLSQRIIHGTALASPQATPAGDPTQRTRGGVTVKIAGFPIVFVPQKKGGGGKTHHTETHTEEHTETKD